MSTDTSNLTQQQLVDYNDKRTAYFKGTIAVATIYGTVALLMFLITIFSPIGKTVITDSMLPFTITFIAGMIIVVVLLLVAIFSVKPPPEFKLEYDNMKCPDYWTLEETPESTLRGFDTSDQARMRYRCRKPNAASTTLTQVDQLPTESSNVKQNLFDALKVPNRTAFVKGTSTTGHINCSLVYPDYMNYVDTKWEDNDPVSPNRLRCEYAKQCNTSWSAVCPSN
jgi:hypothetical protein